MLRRHLESAKKQVALGRRYLRRQRQVLAELERDRHKSAVRARKVLETFENIQDMHLQIRDMIAAELAHAETLEKGLSSSSRDR